ncbi:MAG: hypothetical protein IT464_12640 [Planctomycetes bacterium]|nr:hypothetical protein [Planctomycetota bacterium]
MSYIEELEGLRQLSLEMLAAMPDPHCLDSTDCPQVWRDMLDPWARDASPTFDDCAEALLRNDLKGFFDRADGNTLKYAYAIFKYCYNKLPSPCWGSPEKVNAWAERHSK